MGSICPGTQNNSNDIIEVYIFKGVVLNESHFLIEYILNEKNDDIQNNQNQDFISPSTTIQTSEGVVKLTRFFKESQQETQLIQRENTVYQVSPGEVSMKGLQSLVPGRNRISVRVRIGQFVKIIARNVVIQHQRDGCLKIRINFSIKCMESTEIQSIFNKSIIKSTIRPLREATQIISYTRQIQQKALKLLQQEYQKQNENILRNT